MRPIDGKMTEAIAKVTKDIAADQQSLGADFERIWDENVDTLYERSDLTEAALSHWMSRALAAEALNEEAVKVMEEIRCFGGDKPSLRYADREEFLESQISRARFIARALIAKIRSGE